MTTFTSATADAFTGEIPRLDLPTDRDRGAEPTYRPGRRHVTFEHTLLQRLTRLAADRQTTLAALLLASFDALLSKLTGQDAIVVGVAATPRATTERRTIALLPVRSELRGTRTVRELVAALAPAIPDVDLSASSLHLHVVDLALSLDAGETGLAVACGYNADLFDASTIERWLAGYRRILSAVAASIDSEIGALPWVSAQDLRAIADWNGATAEFPTVCVHELVEAQVRRTPAAIAVRFEGETITYAALNRRANQLARRLRQAGIRRDALVGLCVDRSIDMLVGVLGILKAGGAYVPLDPAYPSDRLAFMMTDSGMQVLVTEYALRDGLTIPPRVRTVCVDDPGIASESDGNLVADGTSAVPESLAYVIYTSGSTGQPKGVLVPHRSVVNLLTSVQRRPGLTASDVVLAITTLSFDIAVSEILLPLSVGAQIVLASRDAASDGAQLLQHLREYGVTFVDATPSSWRLLLDAGWSGGEGLTAICTGEAMPRDLARELVGRVAHLWNGYGPTETTVWSTFWEVTAPVERILIGTPVANTRIYVLDDRMQPVAVGVPGEIYIGGAGVTSGYLNRPALTSGRFLSDPFDPTGAPMYRTGDIGRYLANGQIECFGRNDDQVKVRGFRIELGEIEDALSKHEAMARVAVVAREDRPGDQRLVGYCVLRPGRDVSDATLHTHLSRFLPDYMIPATFVRLESLPLTPSGKVNRRALPAPPAVRHERDTIVPPKTPTETMLVEVWQQALGLEHISTDDDFFSLGGHSLLASHVLARLRRDHGIELLFRTLFEAPTIAQLAAQIDAQPRKASRAQRSIPRRPDTSPGRLSVAQERMWLLEMMDPHQRVVHNLPSAWRLLGELNESVLERSLNTIVARHETLRTAVTVRDAVPYLEVSPVASLALGRLDLRDRPAAEREAAMLAFCDRESRTPHDLSRAPLLRATLVRLDRTEHVLVIAAHNLIWDGWSFDLFLHELDACCAAFASSTSAAPRVPELPISYRDFATWQRDWLASDESAPQRVWWRSALDGTLPVLEMPSDRPRPEEPTRAATHIDAYLSREQVDALSALSAKSGGTLFTILFAAFCLLVHRLSGQDDVLVGTPVRARTRPETEPLLGLFMNMLVLRSHMDRSATFADLLAQVRAMTIDAFSHQELPLEALDVRAPILRAFFTMEDGRQRATSVGNLAVRPVVLLPPAVAADLRLSVTETREGVTLVWTCSSELFDQATAERFLRRFETVLGGVIRDPRQPIGTLDVLPDDERALIRTFGNPLSSVEPTAPVHMLVEQQARRRPTTTAVVHGPETLTYAQLDRRATALAQLLRANQIGPGSRVAVCLTRSADLVVALLAVLKTGGVVVMLDLDDPLARLTAILQDSNAPLVLTSRPLRRYLPETLPQVVSLEDANGSGPQVRELAGAPAPLDSEACVLYTADAHELRSAVVSHRMLAAVIQALIDALPLTTNDVALAVLPPSMDVSIVELLAPLAAGAQLVVADGDSSLDAEYVAASIGKAGATVMLASTMMWSDVLTASAGPWRTFKVVCVGSVPAPEIAAELVSRTSGAWLAHGFTEAGIWTTLHRLTGAEPPAMLGRPLRHTRVRVLDRDCDDAPIGVGGDLCVALDAVAAKGVGLAAEEKRSAMFLEGSDEPWYRTGEIACWRSDGALELVRERDREMPMAGFRINLDDLSAVLRGLAVLKDAAVVVRTQSTQRPRLVAYVTPRDGVAWTATELRRELRLLLPERMIPQSFVEMTAIPRLPDGRLGLDDRRVAAPADDFVPPRSATEVLLARLWREALGLPRVSVHDNFFDLGGYSLLCFQVLERIEHETHHRLSPRLLLLDSLQQVATQLDKMAPTAEPPKPPDTPPTTGGFFKRWGRLLPGGV